MSPQLQPTAKSIAEKMAASFCIFNLGLALVKFGILSSVWINNILLEHILWNNNAVLYPRPLNSHNDTFYRLSCHEPIGCADLASAAEMHKLLTAAAAKWYESTKVSKNIPGQE